MPEGSEYNNLPAVKIYEEDRRSLKLYKIENGFDSIPDAIHHLIQEVDN